MEKGYNIRQTVFYERSNQDMARIALVLEGGSLRCMFSAGVTDVLLEQGLVADGVFGVSAGALTGVNYTARQIGRTARVNLEFVNDKRYLGVNNLLKGRGIFNFDFLFGDISDLYIPLDRETFLNAPTRFTAVATDCRTGRPVYCEKSTCADIYQAIRASASMPLLSPMVDVEGVPCLDGGVSVSIPYQRALDEGYDKLVIVTTREHGFVRPPVAKNTARLYARMYRRYPKLIRQLLEAPRRYAREQKQVDALELSGKAFVIRPRGPVTISRTEKDTAKLQALYDQGRAEADRRLGKLRAFWGE